MTSADPLGWLKSVDDPEYDYKYLTTPQPGLTGEPTMFPRCVPPSAARQKHGSDGVDGRGRGLGGTSQINWMIWHLPQRKEMDGTSTHAQSISTRADSLGTSRGEARERRLQLGDIPPLRKEGAAVLPA